MEMNNQTLLQIFGFPGNYEDNFKELDKFGEKFILKQYGIARKNRIVSIEPKDFKISYAMTTLSGQSGAPVWIQGNIIAIHCGAGNENELSNMGRLITSDLLINLDQLREKLNGSPFKKNEYRLYPYSDRKQTMQNPEKLKLINEDQQQQIRHELSEKD